MTPTDVQVLRVAIAHETIDGGGLGHYTQDIDHALRSFSEEHEHIEGSPFTSSIQGDQAARYKVVKNCIKRFPLLSRSLRKLRKRRPWANAEAWTARWKGMSSDVIILVPHVVIIDQGELDEYYAAIASRTFVLVIHDLHALHYPEQWRPQDVDRMRTRFLMLSNRASRIIVHNEFTAEDVVSKLGVERSRITVALLPAFFSESSFAASTSADRNYLAALRIQSPYALWASSSTFAHKNHLTLLKAWKILATRGHSLQLVCTGAKEPRWNIIEECIKTERLDEIVRFSGVLPDRELAAVVRNAHLAICPTLFEGGGPGPAAEAMMAGIPLTLSDIPQCRQLFDMRTDLCTFFDPFDPASIADAIEAILLDYPAAKRRAEFARSEYATMRTQESAAREYWGALEMAQKRAKRT